jgi:hypothetical protein
MSGAIPPLPNTPSWHGAKLKKHRDNFALCLLFQLRVYDETIQVNECQVGKLWPTQLVVRTRRATVVTTTPVSITISPNMWWNWISIIIIFLSENLKGKRLLGVPRSRW